MKPVIRNQRKPSLAILGIFKNEGDIIREWCQHYLLQGANQIILVNNNSNDDWRGGLAELGHDHRITCINDDRQHSQETIYNDILNNGIIKSEWLLVCDLDEFAYARKGFTTIPEFLATIPREVTSIIIPWKNFGSSGHLIHPDGRVTENFTKRAEICTEIGKAISRTNTIRRITIHEHLCSKGLRIRPSGATLGQSPVVKNAEHLANEDPLHLNHYSVRSLEYYEKVKVVRGNAYSPDHVFGPGYFEIRDKNDIIDTELSKINSNLFGAEKSFASWFTPGLHPLPHGPRPPLFYIPSPHSKSRSSKPIIRNSWRIKAFKKKRTILLKIPGYWRHWRLAKLNRTTCFILAGKLPRKRTDLYRFMATLGQASSPAANPTAPIVINGTKASPESLNQAREWLKLLGLDKRTFWVASHQEAIAKKIKLKRGSWALTADKTNEDIWANAANLLVKNARLCLPIARDRKKLYAFALPTGEPGGFQQEMKTLLSCIAEHHNVPILLPEKLSLEEKLKSFAKYRWIIAPCFADMALIQVLKQNKQRQSTLILLARSKRRARDIVQKMHWAGHSAHRFLLMPSIAAGWSPSADKAAIEDLICWLTHQDSITEQNKNQHSTT